MTHTSQLLQKITDREATIGILGMGYVGLPLMLAFCRAGFRVVGFDIDEKKVSKLNAGQCYLKHIDASHIANVVDKGLFEATTDFADIDRVDSIILCVPTPLTAHREPDLSYVTDTMDAVVPHLREGHVVVLESTTYPGTSSEVIKPRMEEKGFTVGEEVFLAYSPEREDPGNANFETSTIPKIVGADDDNSRRIGLALYENVVTEVVPVSSLAVGEAVKLTENIFRAVNIALVNELKTVFHLMDIDVWEVINAAKTKPFGFMPFSPGPGLGGHCIPIDPFYLTWKAREYEVSTRFIELAGEVNTSMPRYVIDQLALALDDRCSKGLREARILVVGVSYKKNLDDTRESPSLKIMRLLNERKAQIDYYDPLVPVILPTREYPELTGMESVEFSHDVLSQYDAAVICTDHDIVGYQELVNAVPLVVDTRNIVRSSLGERPENVVPA